MTPRVLAMTIKFRERTREEFAENHANDMGVHGLFIRTQSPYQTGTLLKLAVTTADREVVLDLVGRVEWSTGDKPIGPLTPRSGIGVKVIKPSDEPTKALLVHMDMLRRGAPSAYQLGLSSTSAITPIAAPLVPEKSIAAVECPECGASLAPTAKRPSTWVCRYCKTTLIPR